MGHSCKKPNSRKEEPVKIIFSKKDETEYNIAFTGNIDELRPLKLLYKNSITGTAFISIIGDNQFLNVKIKDYNYITEVKVKDGKLSLLPLVEHFTSKMIRSNAELRGSVEVHYKTRVHALYDNDFCLRDMVKVN